MNESKDPYGFIMNPDKPPRKPALDLSGAGMLQRALIFGGGIIVLIILLVMGMSFLNKSSNAQSDKLLEVVQAQHEIVRISTSAQEKITDKDLFYRAINTQVSVDSSKQELIAILSKRKVKVDDKKLSKNENPQNDAVLVEGEQSGKFNEAYEELLNKQLSDYQILLQNAYDGSSQSEKEVIQKSFNQLKLLSAKDQ
ncbi:hypothetical protein HZB74_01745 [Candidatus Saccharibacteria bacterium]|nr:hypothetical protein [Candidatus Saccharibacteria bacterium]